MWVDPDKLVVENLGFLNFDLLGLVILLGELLVHVLGDLGSFLLLLCHEFRELCLFILEGLLFVWFERLTIWFTMFFSNESMCLWKLLKASCCGLFRSMVSRLFLRRATSALAWIKLDMSSTVWVLGFIAA